MYLFCIIGATGQGKSEFIKTYIKGKKCFVFDVQNEYGERTKYPNQVPQRLSNNYRDNRARFIVPNKEQFIKICLQKRNTICVFEEATMFFQGMVQEDMRHLIFSKYHTGNIFLLVFHSINSVPPRILEAVDYFVLYKTADTEKKIKNKYDVLIQPFKKLQTMKDGSNLIIKNI